MVLTRSGRDAADVRHRGAVDVDGTWVAPAGREHRFRARVVLCPRFRPHLVAVLLHGDADLPRHLPVHHVRSLHAHGARHDVARPGSPCGCSASDDGLAAGVVTICLTDGVRLRLTGLDPALLDTHVDACWARARLRLAGGFF